MEQVKVKEISQLRAALNDRSDIKKLYENQVFLVADWVNSFVHSESRLLEIGCGSGVLGKYITCRYAGVDPIEHSDLEKNIEFKVGRIEDVPYASKFFDYILIKDAINYFAKLDPLFIEGTRVLADDGVILITEFVGPNYHPLKQKMKNFIKRLGIRRNMWDRTYLSYYTSHDIIEHARRVGLSAEYQYSRSDFRYYLTIRKM